MSTSEQNRSNCGSIKRICTRLQKNRNTKATKILAISFLSFQKIFMNNLNMRLCVAKSVTHLLVEQKKEDLFNKCQVIQ